MRPETTTCVSQLPDLIYRDVRARRIHEAHQHLTAPEMRLPERLHRLTLFTTFRCNLACRYCHTIQHGPAAPGQTDYTLARFRRLLERLDETPIAHLHFTGGEATLLPDLPEMAAAAHERGTQCSLTTNGMASPEMYERLVEAGVQEIRISCDSHRPEQFDAAVRRPGAHHHVITTIHHLARLRDAGRAPLYLIINMCVGSANQAQLVEAVQRFVSLGPDDVKLIPISTESGRLSRAADRHRLLDELEHVLDGLPPQRFPLLRRKVNTIFDEYTWGLTDPNSKRLMQHCCVPLGERTVAGDGYYACPVYVREGGPPLGRLDEDDFRAQQRASLAFARGDSCRTDALCRDNCINCLKRFNLEANLRITGTMVGKSGRREPVTAILEYADPIPRATVREHVRRIEQERRAWAERAPYRPFLVIKPNGLKWKDRILEELARRRIRIAATLPIPDWNAAAMRFYSVPLTERRVFFGLLMARALPLIEGTARAELLLLEGDYSGHLLQQAKQAVRQSLPPANYAILYQDDVYCISPGYLHSPDPRRHALEARVLLP